MSIFRPQKNFALSQAQKTDARLAISELPEGMTLLEAVKLAKRGSGLAVERVTVTDVVTRFLASRLSQNLRPSSSLWYENKLRPVLSNFGPLTMDEVTRPEFAKAIDALPVSQSTKASHYRAARALWRWAKGQEPPLAGADITEGLKVSAPLVDSEGAEFLSVEDVGTIMRNLPEKHLPAAALLIFAGIRPQEISGKDKPPMLWKHINASARTIRIEASIAKTRELRVLEDMPEALWSFIGEHPGDSKRDEPVAQCTSQQLIRMIQQAGGFWKFIEKGRGRLRKTFRQWPHDATRHTFATYDLAAFENPGRTAMRLGHQGKPQMLYAHYKGLTTKEAALRFWALRRKV